MPGPRRTRRPLVALIVLGLILVIGYTVQALDHHNGGSGPSPATATASTGATGTSNGSAVALSSLPIQAQQTVGLIRAGGPFPFSQDGVVFRNAEHHLPSRASGYYHEYTVTTPGAADRGARRIITGKGGEFYYTADHYDSFVRVDVTR